MKSTRAKLLLFADGTADPVDTIKELSHDATNYPLLKVFLRLTLSALHRELAETSSASRKRYPDFASFSELANWLAEANIPHIGVQAVLLCVAQIGVLIREYEINPTIIHADESNPLCCIGLCNGMISATSAAFCRSGADLLAVGSQLVCLNLRLLLVLMDRSDAIEASKDTWTIITPNLGSQEHEAMIAAFVEKHILPISRHPYISGEAEQATTISGPPSTLALYFESNNTLRLARKISTSVNTACHAPHIRSSCLAQIVGDRSLWAPYRMKDHVKFFSCHTGRIAGKSDLSALLYQCVEEILNERFHWNRVVLSLCDYSKQSCSDASIYAVGPDRVAPSLRKELSTVGIHAEIVNMKRSTTPLSSSLSDDIAIVGIAGRLPNADNLDEVWSILQNGTDTCRPVLSKRFAPDVVEEAAVEEHGGRATSWGCFIEEPGMFDARLFNMSPREARQTDPMHRLALMTTYEALEMAGYSPNTFPAFNTKRIAAYFGQTVDEYRENCASDDVDIFYVTGGVRAFAPGRINYHFKWGGLSMSVDTACSSSAMAIQLAVRALQSQECGMAVAGGMNVIAGQDMTEGLCKSGFTSRTGQCKTFDNAADGYCRGEGVGTVVLKRLQDAEADGDNILAVIKAVATNHSAQAISITRPDAQAQIEVMRETVMKAGIEPHEVSYVEMHGTGTQVGDATEFASVSQVFCNRERKHALYVGSIKANVGHSEAAAGINSLIKIVLMLKHQSIPPHIGIRSQINKAFTSEALKDITINQQEVNLPECNSRTRILLNSFDAAGGNTAMLLEKVARQQRVSTDPRSFQVVTVSGHSQKTFLENLKRLAGHLKSTHGDLRDVAYTTTARRMHHSIRAAYVAANMSDIVHALEQDVRKSSLTRTKPVQHSIVFVFSGQGSHFLQKARQLYSQDRTFARLLQSYDDMCQTHDIPSFLAVFDEGHEKELNQVQSQVSLVAIQMAFVMMLKLWGVRPSAVIGHSIGEYAALFAAEVLSAADTLYLVATRAMLMDKLSPDGTHSMLNVSGDLVALQTLLAEPKLATCVIACYNSPSSQVVSGSREKLDILATLCSEAGLTSKPIAVDFAFHSPQMNTVGEEFLKHCKKFSFSKPAIPVASTFLGRMIFDNKDFAADHLSSHMTEPVRFCDAVRSLVSHLGPDTTPLFVEVGTHPNTGPVIRSSTDCQGSQITHVLHRDENPWYSISHSLARIYTAGVDINWYEYHKGYRHALRVVELPTYAFDLQDHWIPSPRRVRDARQVVEKTQKIDPALAPFHFLQSKDTSSRSAKVVLACDLSQPSFMTLIQGHLVEGVGLCPSSVYAFLAFEAAGRIVHELGLDRPRWADRDLTAMEIISPLIVKPNDKSQLLLVVVEWTADSDAVAIQFSTATDQQKVTHCRCKISAGDKKQWLEQWQEHEYLIQSRIKSLSSPKETPIQLIHRDMMYHLFATSIVAYSTYYQICQRISIDYEHNESVAELRIPSSSKTDVFTEPCFLDALAHTAGFVLNSSPKHPPDTKFIASGWSGLRLAGALEPDTTYQCHSRMTQEGNSNLFYGNVTILCDNRIVGCYRGLRFHRLQRKSLRMLLRLNADGINQRPSLSTKNVSSFDFKADQTLVAIAQTSKSERTKSRGQQRAAKPEFNISDVLKDVAYETGVPLSQLKDVTPLANLGIDSLVSISLLERFKRRLGRNLPSNILYECSTVGALKEAIEALLTANKTADKPLRSKTDIPVKNKKAASSSLHKETSAARIDERKRSQIKPYGDILRGIIADETGISQQDVSNARSASDLGIDSLLTISIMQTYKVHTGRDLHARWSSSSMSLQDLFRELDGASGTDSDDPDTDTPESSATSNSTELTVPSSPDLGATEDVSDLTCVSLLLQGDADTSDGTIFFLPDGSGSLFSYIHLPKIMHGLAVYALDSPFHKHPEAYTISFEAVARIYVAEIRRIQPHGPYNIAGWSIGGVHAFLVTQLLLAAGETVAHLTMIDSPCPGTLPPLPVATMDLLEKAGIFNALDKEEIKVADHTRQHFIKAVDAFQQWDYRPLNQHERANLGQVSVVWAQQGVLEHDEEAQNAWVPGLDQADADMLRAKEWLVGKRTSFGTGGWDNMTGKEIRLYSLPGNHFSIVFPPLVDQLAQILEEILRGVNG